MSKKPQEVIVKSQKTKFERNALRFILMFGEEAWGLMADALKKAYDENPNVKKLRGKGE